MNLNTWSKDKKRRVYLAWRYYQINCYVDIDENNTFKIDVSSENLYKETSEEWKEKREELIKEIKTEINNLFGNWEKFTKLSFEEIDQIIKDNK